MSSVDFVLEALAYDVQMTTAGTLAGDDIPTLDVSATAVIDVSVDLMKQAFTFHSDSLDFDNEAADDVIYYVAWPESLSQINASNAIVSDGAIAGVVGAAVKEDFIRHIAEDLFNTHHGVDLFDNEAEMVADLEEKAGDAWDAGPLLTLGAANGLDNSNTANTNIGRVLFRQLVKAQKARFDDGLVAVDGETNKFLMPFVAGDSISFKVTYKAVEGQGSIIDRADEVPDRTYAIKLNMVAA